MFGFKLIHESQLTALYEKIDAANAYAAKCEALIEHERERIDMERERADRIADSVFQQNGLAPASATVVREMEAAEKISAGKREDHLKELLEIYGEMESDLADEGEAAPLPEPIAELVGK
jgi:hypothetical protein